MRVVSPSFPCFALFASCTGDVRQKPAVAVPESIPRRQTAALLPTATARTPVPVAGPTSPEPTTPSRLRERESRREPVRPVRRRVQPEVAEERDAVPPADVEANAPALSSESPAMLLRAIAAKRRNWGPCRSYALGSRDLLTVDS